jgi:beta-N-acetylhexosaminidase
MSSIDHIINKMSLRQKIGQMVCVRAYDYKEKIQSMLSEGLIGALGAIAITQKGTRNLEEVVASINKYYKLTNMPLLLYLDAECGITDMFNFGTPFPSSMALGATFSKELAYRMGNVIGKEARSLGFTIICSPVLDINNNPDNPIINTRAISDNPDLVTEIAGEYIRGMQDAGIIPTGKHFPGHGDTSVDSHVSMPVVEHKKEYLMNMELKPYRELINKKSILGIMTAHILYPELLGKDEEKVPATLSRNIITNLLRNELNFEGLIVSDSLAMKGIKDLYGVERSAVMAVKAGHDIILQDYKTDPELTINAVISAVESGEIDERQIENSVKRILELRERLGNLDNKLIHVESVRQITGSKEHIAVAQEIADKSMTVLEARELPFCVPNDRKVLVIATQSEEEGTVAEDLHSNIKGKTGYLYSKCRNYCNNAELLIINENPDEDEINKLLEVSRNYDYIIYASFVRVISYKEGSGTIPQSQINLIHSLNRLNSKITFIIFGSPYALRKLERLQDCIVAYSDCEYSIDSALKVLFGEIQSTGKLPVNVDERYGYGFGL